MKSSTDVINSQSSLFAHYKRAKPFTALDAIILIAVTAAIICASIFAFGKRERGSYADIYYKGELVATYSLAENARFALPGEETIQIDINEGKIAVTENDCPNQICVKSGYISLAGERIVCAYHKVSIVVRSESGKSILITGGAG